MRSLVQKFKQLMTSILYCYKLCWRASPLYTLFRLIGKFYQPIIGVVSAYLSKLMLDILASPSEGAFRDVLIILLLTLFITLIGLAVRKVVSYAESMQNDIMQKQIALSMMEKSLNADLALFDNAAYNDKFEKVHEDSHVLSFVVWNAIDCISSFFSFVGTFAVLCGMNFWYGIVIALAAIPSAIASQKYTKILYHVEYDQMNSIRKRSYISFLAASKHYAQEVRLYRLGDMLKARYVNLWNTVFFPKKKLIRKRTVITTIMEFIPEIVIMAINIDVTYKVLTQVTTIGDFSLYSGIIAQLLSAVLLTISSIRAIYENQLKIENIRSFEGVKNSIVDNGTLKIKEIRKITFDHVTFRYPETERDVLRDVSFVINHKEKVALVGVNGAGKSTIVKLLLRFYEPTSGRILINDVDIQRYRLKDLRNCLSCYFQNSLNYGFSILENIRISNQEEQNVDIDKVWNALSYTDMKKVVKEFDQGLDTVLTRQYDLNGVELSGGQYQKIALARTFYRNSSFCIFDEPSSSLDPESEAFLFDSMEKICKDKTVLFISHRLNNITLADKIIVIEDGILVEQGTKKELLSQNGRFATLYRYQMNKFKGT